MASLGRDDPDDLKKILRSGDSSPYHRLRRKRAVWIVDASDADLHHVADCSRVGLARLDVAIAANRKGGRNRSARADALDRNIEARVVVGGHSGSCVRCARIDDDLCLLTRNAHRDKFLNSRDARYPCKSFVWHIVISLGDRAECDGGVG